MRGSCSIFPVALLALLFGGFASAAAPGEVVIDDQGRQIQLNGDGTWVQVSRDRFATNAAGERIRLRPNGTWSLIQPEPNAPDLEPGIASTPKAPVLGLPADDVSFFLARLELLKKRKNRGKSNHSDIRWVFTVVVENQTSGALRLNASPDRFQVENSRGLAFDVLSAFSEKVQLGPGERTEVRVVAGEPEQRFAPQVNWGVKYLSLHVAPNTLGNTAKRTLSQNMDQIVRREVSSF